MKRLISCQKERLVELMEEHFRFSNTRNPSTVNRIRTRELWQEVARELNSIEYGITRSAAEWRKCFTAMRINVQTKIQQIRQHQQLHGDSRVCDVDLTEIDEQIYKILENSGGLPESAPTLESIRAIRSRPILMQKNKKTAPITAPPVQSGFANFTSSEQQLLLRLATAEKAVLESTDPDLDISKGMIWIQITDEFNANKEPDEHRTEQALREKYHAMERDIRRHRAMKLKKNPTIEKQLPPTTTSKRPRVDQLIPFRSSSDIQPLFKIVKKNTPAIDIKASTPTVCLPTEEIGQLKSSTLDERTVLSSQSDPLSINVEDETPLDPRKRKFAEERHALQMEILLIDRDAKKVELEAKKVALEEQKARINQQAEQHRLKIELLKKRLASTFNGDPFVDDSNSSSIDTNGFNMM